MKPSYKKLELLLMKEDINVSKLCEKINISPSTFSDWKSKKSFPKVDKLYLIANYFDVTIEYFLEDEV
jgi:bacteriophage CI repressor helix-turn-helix domain